MRWKQTLHNVHSGERGVSPVIGVILMVAITVILAAVIAFFVLGIGEDQSTTPNTAVDFSQERAATWHNGWDDNGIRRVTITTISGDALQANHVEVLAGDTLAWGREESSVRASYHEPAGPQWNSENLGGEIKGGDSMIVEFLGPGDRWDHGDSCRSSVWTPWINNYTELEEDEYQDVEQVGLSESNKWIDHVIAEDENQDELGICSQDGGDKDLSENPVTLQPDDEITVRWNNPNTGEATAIAKHTVN